MLNKLAFRNAKRSTRDYLVYLITMTIIAGLMFAFNSMIFSEDIKKISAMAGIVPSMIGLASFFIIIIVAWLVNYMITFMMQKKSKEFGTYLLIGMKKKEVARLFMRENQLLGLLALFPGIPLGIFLQQVLTSIFYSVFEMNYQISLNFSCQALLLTLILYVLVFIISLIRHKKKFRKMNISDYMRLEKINEQVKEKNTKIKQFFFFAAIIYFLFFDIMLFLGWITIKNVFFILAGLIAAIYMLYSGIAAFVVEYIKKKKNGVYKSEKLFLLRQFSSKIKTMQFTLGTLTILFSAALIGCTLAIMLGDANKKMLGTKLPFDAIVFSDEADDKFEDYIEILEKETTVRDKIIYQVYEDKTTAINDYIYENFEYFTSNAISKEKAEDDNTNYYFDYDTYIRLSDYNALREMLGYERVKLSNQGYLIQVKERLKPTLSDFSKSKGGDILVGGKTLDCEGIYTDEFAQNGHNGADYIIVVPDETAKAMKPYYSLLAVDIKGNAPDGLQDKLEELKDYYNDTGEFTCKITWGNGTDMILTMSGIVLVQTNSNNLMRFLMTMMVYPLVYIAIVFVCVALTVLAVQQLSDSAKYKFRYSVLSKLGLNDKEIDRIILKQLAIYYLCPFLTAVLLSGVLSLFMSERFIYYTGVHSKVFSYYGMSVLIFGFVYLLYFAATYVGFKRNITEK